MGQDQDRDSYVTQPPKANRETSDPAAEITSASHLNAWAEDGADIHPLTAANSRASEETAVVASDAVAESQPTGFMGWLRNLLAKASKLFGGKKGSLRQLVEPGLIDFRDFQFAGGSPEDTVSSQEDRAAPIEEGDHFGLSSIFALLRMGRTRWVRNQDTGVWEKRDERQT